MIAPRRASSGHRRRTRLRAAVAVVAVGWVMLATTGSATAAPDRAGAVAVVDAGARAHQLSHGGSSTQFSIDPPAGATCPGDSAHDQWRVQTFLVPAADDPATLHYGVVGPDGANQYALFDEFTHPVVDALLTQNPEAGQPAIIPTLPALRFAVFPPGTLPDGNYTLGIACTKARETSSFWDTEIVITGSADDRPAQLVWRLASAPPSVDLPNSDSDRGLIVTVVAAVALAAGAFGVLMLASRRRSITTSKDRP